MQKAIENFINIQVKKMVPLEEIENEIDMVEKTEIDRARKKQLRQWRKLDKGGRL